MFNFNIYHGKRTINIALETDWDSIESIVFRVRVFQENQQQYINVLKATKDRKRLRVCKYNNDLGINSQSFAQLQDRNFINLGYEVEMLHILANDGKHWTKWQYPWNDNPDDMQRLMLTKIKDLNSRLFGIGDDYYLLYNMDFPTAWDQYTEKDWEELRELSHDVILFCGELYGILNETLHSDVIKENADLYWKNQDDIALKKIYLTQHKRMWDRKALKHHHMDHIKSISKYPKNKFHKSKHLYNRW